MGSHTGQKAATAEGKHSDLFTLTMLPEVAKPRRTNGNRSVRAEQPPSDESLVLSYLVQELYLQKMGVTVWRAACQRIGLSSGNRRPPGPRWGLSSSKVLRLWHV